MIIINCLKLSRFDFFAVLFNLLFKKEKFYDFFNHCPLKIKKAQFFLLLEINFNKRKSKKGFLILFFFFLFFLINYSKISQRNHQSSLCFHFDHQNHKSHSNIRFSSARISYAGPQKTVFLLPRFHVQDTL